MIILILAELLLVAALWRLFTGETQMPAPTIEQIEETVSNVKRLKASRISTESDAQTAETTAAEKRGLANEVSASEDAEVVKLKDMVAQYAKETA